MKVHSQRPPISPLLVIFLGILAVSTSSIFIRFAQQNASSLIIAAYRLTLATIILIPAAMGPGKTDFRKLGKRQVGLAILSGVFLALHFATWISSLAYTTVASSVVLVDTSPLWVALLAPILLKEKISRMVLIGLVVTLIGGFFIGLSDICRITGTGITCPSLSSIVDGKFFLGDGLALLGALFAAGYLMIGRELRPKMTLVSYTFLVYGIAALVLIGIVGAARLKPFGYPPTTYIWFLALAIIPQLIGHSSFNWSLRYLSAAFVSITILGESIGSTVLALLILGEIPPLIKIVGAVLILAGIVLASKVEQRPEIPDRIPQPEGELDRIG
jgi:drug/metabolite transporter (DMT)-like permease